MGTNPSADPGAKTEGGRSALPAAFGHLRDWRQSDKFRGSGGWPPVRKTLLFPLPQNSSYSKRPVLEQSTSHCRSPRRPRLSRQRAARKQSPRFKRLVVNAHAVERQRHRGVLPYPLDISGILPNPDRGGRRFQNRLDLPPFQHVASPTAKSIGRLATHPMHAKSGVAQRLPQGVAMRSRRFHGHRHASISRQNPQKRYQRHDLRRILRLPRPLECPVGPTRHRENFKLPDIHPNIHIPKGQITRPNNNILPVNNFR